MIKNIVFDVGNVLVDFRYHNYMLEMGFKPEAVKIIEEKLIGNSALWSQLDLGREPEMDTVNRMLSEVPGYEADVHRFFDNVIDIVETYQYTVPWLTNLREKGYKIYLLSNYPKNWWTLHEENRFGFTHLTDGKTVSGFVKVVKPGKEIYELLLSSHGLIADECLFFDDRKENVEAAKKLGINGHVFTSYEDACGYLDMLEKEGKAIGIK